jgi:hypothetical protein
MGRRRVLYCAKCNEPIVVEKDVPAVCPNTKCGSSTWQSAKNPSKPYTLSAQDKTFLKINGIDPE